MKTVQKRNRVLGSTLAAKLHWTVMAMRLAGASVGALALLATTSTDSTVRAGQLHFYPGANATQSINRFVMSATCWFKLGTHPHGNVYGVLVFMHNSGGVPIPAGTLIHYSVVGASILDRDVPVPHTVNPGDPDVQVAELLALPPIGAGPCHATIIRVGP